MDHKNKVEYFDTPVGQVVRAFTMDRGYTGEFSRVKAEKKFWFHVRKKNRSQKNVTKHNSCHPQNR